MVLPIRGLLIWIGLIASTTLRANSLAQFRTVLGDLEVELLDAEKPATVANFKRYVAAGLYNNSFLHRVVNNDIFVAQGGGFVITDPVTTFLGTIPTFPPVTNEFLTGPFRSNVAGTIAMAKSANPDSATSQFFFNLLDNSAALDNTNNSGGFTVFGRVRGETNVLAVLNSFVRNPASGTNLIYNAGGVFAELPLLTFRLSPLKHLDASTLIYVDISLLSVRVTGTPAGREISWDSARGGTNHVEFTTEFPPVWQSLTNLVKPAGARSSVIDANSDRNRFYRVRISY